MSEDSTSFIDMVNLFSLGAIEDMPRRRFYILPEERASMRNRASIYTAIGPKQYFAPPVNPGEPSSLRDSIMNHNPFNPMSEPKEPPIDPETDKELPTKTRRYL